MAGDEINYRRFFDINDLAAIRMEDPAVFEAAHRLLLPPGRARAGSRASASTTPTASTTPAQLPRVAPSGVRARRSRGRGGRPRQPAAPFYVVVEKVLDAAARPSPSTGRCTGPRGYEFLNALNGLFVDPEGARALEQTYQRITGLTSALADVVHQTKRLITDTTMASELNVLGRRLARLAEHRRESRDFTQRSLTEGLREIVACFPVYRTYIGDHAAGAQRAGSPPRGAGRGGSPAPQSAHESVRLRVHQRPAVPERATLDFVRRFQQITGPVTAKGVEDTAFYRYAPLLSLNEVGGDARTLRHARSRSSTG